MMVWDMFDSDVDQWLHEHSSAAQLITGEAAKSIVREVISQMIEHLQSRGFSLECGAPMPANSPVLQCMAALHGSSTWEAGRLEAFQTRAGEQGEAYQVGYSEVQIEVSHTNGIRIDCPIFIIREGILDKVLYLLPTPSGFDTSLLRKLGGQSCVVAKPSLEWMIINAAPELSGFAPYVIRNYQETSLI